MRELRIRLRDAAAVAALGDRSLRNRRAPEAEAAHMLERALLRSRAAPRRPLSAQAGEAALSESEAAGGR